MVNKPLEYDSMSFPPRRNRVNIKTNIATFPAFFKFPAWLIPNLPTNSPRLKLAVESSYNLTNLWKLNGDIWGDQVLRAYTNYTDFQTLGSHSMMLKSEIMFNG